MASLVYHYCGQISVGEGVGIKRLFNKGERSARYALSLSPEPPSPPRVCAPRLRHKSRAKIPCSTRTTWLTCARCRRREKERRRRERPAACSLWEKYYVGEQSTPAAAGLAAAMAETLNECERLYARERVGRVGEETFVPCCLRNFFSKVP